MPNPVVTIPGTPLVIDDATNEAAESFVATLLQIFEHGTVGLADPTQNTDPTYEPNDQHGNVGPMLLRSRAQQLFFRQLALALATSGLTGGGGQGIVSPYLAQNFVSGGVSRGDGVYLSGTGIVSRGNSADDTHAAVIGVAAADAAAAQPVSVILAGIMGSALVGATPGVDYYLGAAGQPVLFSSLVPGKRIIRLGYASSPTDLQVQVVDLGVR